MMSRVLVSMWVTPTGRRRYAGATSVRAHRSSGCTITNSAAPVPFVTGAASAMRHAAGMGDKSLKAKQRDQKQRDAAKQGSIAAAKAKQDSHSQVPPPVAKAPGKA